MWGSQPGQWRGLAAIMGAKTLDFESNAEKGVSQGQLRVKSKDVRPS